MEFSDYHDTVLEAIKEGARTPFFRPHYEKYSLPNLSSTLLSHFTEISDNLIDDDPILEMMEGCQTLVLLLVDGLGYNFVRSSGQDDELPRKLLDCSLMIPITSTFPSTTTTALTSLNTALTPQEHGIVGHTMYLKEYGTIANMIKFSPAADSNSETLTRAGLVPEEFLGASPIYEILKREGVNSTVLTKWIYKRSMLSRMLHKGSEVIPYITSPDLFTSLRREVRRGTSFIFAYWDALDSLSHAYGPRTEEVMAEFRNFLFSFFTEFISRLDRKTGKKTCVFMTGDHGLVGVEDDGAIVANDYQSLMRNLERPPAGDSRASFLKLVEGKRDAIEKFFLRFEGRIDLFETDSLVEDGFLGRRKMREGVREAVGDLVALSRKGTTFRYRFKKREEETTLRGHHGGLIDEELFVPLLVMRPES